MSLTVRKENIQLAQKSQDTAERSKSQNKYTKVPIRIKNNRPSISSKKENVNTSIATIIQDYSPKEEKQMKKETDGVCQETLPKKEKDQNGSFLNDFNLNIESEQLPNKDESNKQIAHALSNNASIQKYDYSDKQNTVLKNNISQDQKVFNSNSRNTNNNNGNHLCTNNMNVGSISNIINNFNSNRSISNANINGININNWKLPMSGNNNGNTNVLNSNANNKIYYSYNKGTAAKIGKQGVAKTKQRSISPTKQKSDTSTTDIQNAGKIISTQLNQKQLQQQQIISDETINENDKNINEIAEESQNDEQFSNNKVQGEKESLEQRLSLNSFYEEKAIRAGGRKKVYQKLKENLRSLESLEIPNRIQMSDQHRSIEIEGKLPPIQRLSTKQKETTLYNQLRENNQKNALELPQIIDTIKQNINSCENLFQNRLKERVNGMPDILQQENIQNNQKMNKGLNPLSYDVQVDVERLQNRNSSSQKGIQKSIQNREVPLSAHPLRREIDNYIVKRDQKDGNARELSLSFANRKDSSMSHYGGAESASSVQLLARNRVMSEHNMNYAKPPQDKDNSSISQFDKLIKDSLEEELTTTAERKKLKKLNQLNIFLKSKFTSPTSKESIVSLSVRDQLPQESQDQINIAKNNESSDSNLHINKCQSESHINVQEFDKQDGQKQQPLIKNMLHHQSSSQSPLQGKYNFKVQIKLPIKDSPLKEHIPQSVQQKNRNSVIQVIDKALIYRKENNLNKCISVQLDKEIEKLNVLSSKSLSAREEQMKIQYEHIKYNLKIKLSKFKAIDVVIENVQEDLY